MEQKLIEFVRRHPYLYDKNDENYRNILLKDEKWLEFSNITNIAVAELKRRWKTLRDRYFRLVKSGDPIKKYKYFDDLKFLSGIKTTQKRKTFEIQDETAVDEFLTKSEDSLLLDEASFSSFYKDNKFSTNLAQDDDSLHTPSKKKRKQNVSEDLAETKELREYVKLTPDHVQNTTPFRAFLECIALTVEQANFDINEVMRLQMGILQLVQTEVENHTINTG